VTERVALVTGGARGIGFAVAERMARTGRRVVIVDVAGAEAAAARLVQAGLHVSWYDCDVSDESRVGALLATIVARHGRLDILVNNAGISPKHSGVKANVEHMALAEWQEVLAVNLTSVFLLSRGVLPIMRWRRWGRIVNMSSQAARMRSDIAGAHYAASKAGIIGFSRSLAGEVGRDGITVNCIAPGRILTPMSEAAGEEVNEAYKGRIPVGRLGTVEDVAAACAYLASEDAGFLTGTVLDVTGGSFMT
jgi:3-oxoacyl-[acyl-carrier protein] reductase